MAFRKLSDRELYGVFDPFNLNIDQPGFKNSIRQIFQDRYNFDEISKSSAVQQFTTDRQVQEINLAKSFAPQKLGMTSEENLFFGAAARYEGDYAAGNTNTYYAVKLVDIVQNFVVPRVESLITFTTEEELTNLISDYRKTAIAEKYYFRTTDPRSGERTTFAATSFGSGREIIERQKVSEFFESEIRISSSTLERKLKSYFDIVRKRILDRRRYDQSLSIPEGGSIVDQFSSDDSDGFIKVNSDRRGLFVANPEKEDIILSQNFAPSKVGYLPIRVTRPTRDRVGDIFVSGDIGNLSDDDKQKLINFIQGKEKSLTANELARIIMVQIAIKILSTLARTINQRLSTISERIGLDAEEQQELAASREKILETLKREINENPDFSSLSQSQKENLQKEIRKGLKIRPQCILIRNVLELAKLNRKRLNAVFSETQTDDQINYQYTRMVSNPKNTAATINKLTKTPGQENILNLRPHHYGRLFPYLRFYKVLTFTDPDTKNQTVSEVEFKFPNATNVQNTNPSMDIKTILQNPLTQEYGIKSFDWRFIGSDPFTYANDIEATLVLHFNDFEQLVVEREQGLPPVTKKYRILDLITISEKEREAIKNKDPDAKFDIRVDVGWSGPNDPSELEGFNVRNSIRTLFLTMTDYDISFNEEGHFELTINYKSRLEQSLYDKKTNILVADPTSKRLIEKSEEELEELRRSSDEGNIDLIRELESELEELRLQAKGEAYSNIYSFLLNNNSIFTQPISQELFFLNTGITGFSQNANKSANEAVFGELENLIGTLKNQAKNDEEVANDPTKEKVNYFPVKPDGGNYLLNYFFLGDLVESLAQSCFAKNNKRLLSEQRFLDDTRIVLTDFLLYDPQDLNNKNVLKINIGDIPISVELFMSFYYEKVVKFNVGSYSLMKFIRDLISYCILNIFEDCFGEENIKTNIKTGFADFKKIVSSYKTDSEDPFEYYAVRQNAIARLKLGEIDLGELYKQDSKAGIYSSITKAHLDLTKLDSITLPNSPEIASKDERSDCIHALIISSESFDVTQLKIDPDYPTKREKDIESGLYHLDIGSAKGILKKINFKKTDQKYLREQRFTQDDASGFSILSNVFDVDISLFGNNLFFPGQRVFINLGERFSALGNPWDSGVDGNFANIMGLGGYHIITSVENEISTSGFTTKINARWETSGDGKTKDVTTGAAFKLPATSTPSPGATVNNNAGNNTGNNN